MRFIAALLCALLPAVALAQSLPSPQVITRPLNDNSPRAASTAYVDTMLLMKALGSNSPLRSIIDRAKDFPSVRDYGAKCDAVSRPLSTVYPTLAAAQAVYPTATALADELDGRAIEKALAAFGAANSSGSVSVSIPGPCVTNTTVVWPQQGTIYCPGDGAAVFAGYGAGFLTNTATGDALRVQSAYSTLAGCSFASLVNRTTGYYVNVVDTASRFKSFGTTMWNPAGGFLLGNVSGVQLSDPTIYWTQNAPANSIGINVAGGPNALDVYLLHPKMIGTASATKPSVCLQVSYSGDTVVIGGQITQCGKAAYLNPGPGQIVTSFMASGTFFDTSINAIDVNAAGGQVLRSFCSMCWVGGSSGTAVRFRTSTVNGSVGKVDGFEFQNPAVVFNGDAGIAIEDAGAINIRSFGGTYSQNVNSGFYAAPGTHDFTLQGASIGAGFGLGGNGRPFTISTGASRFSITGNNVSTGEAAPIVQVALTGHEIIQDNVGLPDTWTSYAPTVTAGNGQAFGALGTVVARYRRRGQTVSYSLDLPITTNGSAGTNITVSLPFSPAGVSVLSGRRVNDGVAINGQIIGGGGTMSIQRADNNQYPGGDGTRLTLSGSYEAQ